jgi:hypothetical protein
VLGLSLDPGSETGSMADWLAKAVTAWAATSRQHER